MTACSHPSLPEHSHQALFYRDQAEYLDGIAGFIEPGIEAGEPVAIIVPAPKLELVREQLGDRAAAIELIDMTKLGANPGRIISAVQGMVDRHAGRRLHYVGEPIWPGRSPAEIREATRHEWLVNRVWTAGEARVLCPYDAAGLDETVLADAERTHPGVVRGGSLGASEAYQRENVPRACEQPLSDPPAGSWRFEFDAEDLAGLREVVAERATAAGLGKRRARDLVMAVNELTTNTIRHAGAPGVLRVWTELRALVCQVEDRGHIADPLVGRRRVAPGSGGLGLWMVNQLCDLVEVRTSPGATKVRVRASAAPA